MKVDLNTATVSELMAVGFGRAAAESVIAYRTRHPYAEVPELLKTRHVGGVTYYKVMDSVFVGALPEAKEGATTMDERLESALDGIKLTEQEERYLEWLSRMDGETVEVFAGLFEKIKETASEWHVEKRNSVGVEGKMVATNLFSSFINEPDPERWRDFPDLMWSLGFEMDCYKSAPEYNAYTRRTHTEKEIQDQLLSVMTGWTTQEVGNYIFSRYRELTHWSDYGYPEEKGGYFFERAFPILEAKLRSPSR